MARPFSELASEHKSQWDEDTQAVYEAASAAFEYEINERARLGAMLRNTRERRSLTQPALAELADVQQAEISRIESGKGNPTEATLIRITRALDVRLTLEDAAQV